SSLYAAKQFALQQLPRETRTTDRHKRIVLLWTAIVNRPREDRLARAAFTEDQNGGRRRRGFERQRERALHRRLGGFQIGVWRIRGKPRFEVRYAALQFPPLNDLLQHLPDLVRSEWFGQKIRCTPLDGVHRRFIGSECRANDDIQVRIVLEQVGQQGHATFPVELQIEDRHVERCLLDFFQRARGVL